jgi:hypothetical protein
MLPAGGTIPDAVQFFTAHLGFEVHWQTPTMAGISRGAVSFNLVENTNREWADNSSYSIGVSDVDALYEEYRGIPARVGPLEIKSWGRREFHMIIPSGVCLQFYTQS